MPRFIAPILALTLAAGPAGCADTVAGSSALLKTDRPQSLFGAFDDRVYPITADLDGDGLGDLVIGETRSSSGEVTYHLDGTVDQLVYTSPPAQLWVFYGKPGGFGIHISPSEADAVFTLRVGDRVEALSAADFDGDGADELVVRAPSSYPFDPPPGSVYVLAGGPRHEGSAELQSIAHRTSVPLDARHGSWPGEGPHELDGQPGLEFVAHASDAPGGDVSSVAIYGLHDGGLRARLLPREGEHIRALGVLDLDADGSNDIVCTYWVPAADDMGVVDEGVGVFYGPFGGDRTLGEPGTEATSATGNLYRALVGNYVGDEHDDILLIGGDQMVALPGGSRIPSADLGAALVRLDALAAFLRQPREYGPWFVSRPDANGDGRDEVLAFLARDLVLLTAAGEVLDQLELVHADDSAVGAYYGSNVADLDGDGTLDLALGTFGDISRQGLVHVVYGFGG